MKDKPKLFLYTELEPSRKVAGFTEKELLERLKIGAPLAQTEFFRHNFRPIFEDIRKNHARKESMADAEEIANAVFFTVFWNVNNFKAKSRFSTWVYSHVKNRVIDHYSRPSRFSWIPNLYAGSEIRERPNYSSREDVYNKTDVQLTAYDLAYTPLEDIYDPMGDSDERSEDLHDQLELDYNLFTERLEREVSRGSIERLLECFMVLSRYQRIAICCRKLAGLSLKETGTFMKRKPGTVSAVCRRSVKQLGGVLRVDPYYSHLMPKVRDVPINDFIDRQIFHQAIRNILVEECTCLLVPRNYQEHFDQSTLHRRYGLE